MTPMTSTLLPSKRQAIETLYATGCWLASQARARDAASVFRAMTLLVPRDDRPWVALGRCHEELGQHSVALELYALGAVAAAPSPRCWIARARVLTKLNRCEEASAAFEEAVAAAQAANDHELQDVAEREMQS
jgi:tetratricopeptide (TPR) repeat protein